MAQVHVISGVERRRRWSPEQKRAVVAAAFAPGAVVSQVARQADLCPGQIYRWRQDLAAASCGFAQVVVTAPEPVSCEDGTPAIEVRVGDSVQVRIPAAGRAATVRAIAALLLEFAAG